MDRLLKFLFVLVMAFFTIIFGSKLLAQEYKSFPMWNPALPLEQRVNDVVGRLTLEEKVAQMLNGAPAIERLGIPAHEWWNEILHGVARTPYKVTVFPQAIGMAATWDTAAIRLMAEYAATEGRAVNNIAVAKGKTADKYSGLTYWSPNINIFRDPRWGRGQETYGEDPYLTAKLGAAFVRGIQGDDSRYLLAAACAKHYAVHSGPEPSRHSDNINPSAYDLWDTYLPAFRELIVGAGVAGVMCAYNAVNTQPCCANDLLMNDILRHQWKFQGYVTSDCWAVDDFVKYHKTHKSSALAATDAVFHGTDIECGNTVYRSLIQAVKEGMIPSSQLDVSLKRLFTIRFRLGAFDPPAMVKYAAIGAEVLEAPEHKAHALKMARESVVLLKNDHATLPLSKKIRSIAVVGPNANSKSVMLGNYNGFPSHVVSVLEGIRQKLGEDVKIIYDEGTGITSETLFQPDEEKPDFNVTYFNNTDLQGNAVYNGTISGINFAWPEAKSPAPGVSASHFSARFTGNIPATDDTLITWRLEGDDGYRLWINDSLVINRWKGGSGSSLFKWKAKKGVACKVVLEYWQGIGAATIRMERGGVRKADLAAVAAKAAEADAIVYVGGISPDLEGEAMRVNAAGFNGGDRTTILLPAVQTALLQQLKATGKPVVLVLLTGSAIALPWEQQQIPAILNAWYGGQSGGTAVADVLFGDYNPSGRLPVTFYAADSDLSPFGDYNMSNRTYRYFRGKPLYPFGYGLSYTTFQYADLRMPDTVQKDSLLRVAVTVRNTGAVDGEEVVQLYISHPHYNGKAPLKSLQGFQRIFLKKGESRRIQFALKPEQLMLVDEQGHLFNAAGAVQVHIGGGQPGVLMGGVAKVLSGEVKVGR
ncbi:MAG TPA: glycoside hydrolase family 3 C-terminal domain-containing protein [Chitinophaga sp.]|uniref:glycoside hydrolase family 3 C-terminal domain-containing protein n=1 Tax=Chitinophaga sp. TaxID=1869181 RepID=UPI002CEB6F42|nr:glycoside hydrolase family 3 C-terminal domain-containing protein [Chitinophaga sp.]HVI45643.1 glycoside hydrolase family 3 C-terminal domain-containing protein [Chitinophaga sp.]